MKKTGLAVIALLILILNACAPSVEAVQTAIAQTQASWTPVPTQTPYPTYTPIPSMTPTATPAISAEMVIAAFKAAGLEAEDTRPMTKKDYGAAPYVCQGTRFFIPSLGPDNGGRLFICGDLDQLASLSHYYTALGEGSALFFSWVFSKEHVLVQINGDLPEETARKYEAAIP